jgi:NADP-dependent 3-hydroxy acid dehydrogenase YdfG
VLAGVNLHAKMVVITGGHSGLGLETTRALTSAGAEVIVASRDFAAASKAIDAIPGVRAIQLDLANLSNVSATARALVDAGRPIDILINNAGIMAGRDGKRSLPPTIWAISG